MDPAISLAAQIHSNVATQNIQDYFRESALKTIQTFTIYMQIDYYYYNSINTIDVDRDHAIQLINKPLARRQFSWMLEPQKSIQREI